MRLLVLVILATAIVGCGKTPSSKTSEAQGVAPADSDLPMPGKYESATSAQFTIPGEGIRQLDRADALCISGSARADVVAAINNEFKPICTGGEIKLRHGDVSGQLTCRIAELRGAESVVSFGGNYDRESIEITLDTSIGGASVRQSRPYKRVGDC